MGILEYLGFGGEKSDRPVSDDGMSETVRKLVDELNHLEPERARFVAAFAYILSRAARADLHICEKETRTMERIVMDHAGLPEEQSILVVQIAKSQNLLFGGTENFLVTRELNRIASREQKLALLECLFAVCAADESISTAEDTVVRQVADELHLEHSDFIEVRRRFREHLAVLKKPGADREEV